MFREPVRHLTQSRSRRPRVGTSWTHQHCLRAMNATLSKQFEGFAECCLELARSAETTERRARFIQMAHEYRLATLLTSEEPSSGPKGRRLLPAAESPLLIAAEAPASRAQTRPQPSCSRVVPRRDTLASKLKCLTPINKTGTCRIATKVGTQKDRTREFRDRPTPPSLPSVAVRYPRERPVRPLPAGAALHARARA